MVWWATCSQFRTPPHVLSPASRGASTSRQPYVSSTGCQSADEWISRYPPLSRVRSLAPLMCYLADECTLVTAASRRPLRSADNRTCLVKRSRNQFGDPSCFATAGGTVCLNSFGNRASPSDNSNDRWKRLCLVSWPRRPMSEREGRRPEIFLPT